MISGREGEISSIWAGEKAKRGKLGGGNLWGSVVGEMVTVAGDVCHPDDIRTG
jgi:hypothetical protein